jgi:hypothetical protein
MGGVAIIGIVLFALIGGYVIQAIFVATYGNWFHLKLVGLIAAGLVAYGLYDEGKSWVHGADDRYEFETGTACVAYSGPIAFQRSDKSLQTTIATASGTYDVGFRIDGIVRGSELYDLGHCVTREGDHDLLERVGDAPGKICIESDAGTVRYESRPEDGTIISLDCDRDPAQTFCGMRFVTGDLLVRVHMWKTPPSQWRAARDHIEAIIAQSFWVIWAETP